ncbi:MAG: hypothetical protein AB1500_00870 [Bacillota bacterium]
MAGPGREAGVRYNEGWTKEGPRPGMGQGCFQTGSATMYRCGTGRLRLVVDGSFRGAVGERLRGAVTAGGSRSGSRKPPAVFVGEVSKNSFGCMQVRDSRRYATSAAVPDRRKIFQGLVSRQGILGFTAGGGFRHPLSGGRVLKLPRRVLKLPERADYHGAENNFVRKPLAGRKIMSFPPVQMFTRSAYSKNTATAVLPDGAVSVRPQADRRDRVEEQPPISGARDFSVTKIPQPHGVDLSRLADRLYGLIERKLRIERERRGKPCW